MAKLNSLLPVFGLAFAVSMAIPALAQNPPMNCTPDGIVEVCTLADNTSAQNVPASAPDATPALPQPAVAYSKGQLTIKAENVPLKDVLQEVAVKTGAKIDVPQGGGTEAVFINIGPAPVRDVLVALLNGSGFNYVIAGSSQTGDLESVVLTPADQSSMVASNVTPAVQPVLPVPAHSSVFGGLSGGAAPSDADRQSQIEAARQNAFQEAMQEHAEDVKNAASAGPAPADPPNPE